MDLPNLDDGLPTTANWHSTSRTWCWPSPTGFEDLVIRLLESMGYGRAGTVEQTGAARDVGVDGIISQDPLGLDRINARIELIDGSRLSELLVKYRVGVQVQQTVSLYRLYEDFFETL